MSKILYLVESLLSEESKNAVFVEVKPDYKQDKAYVLNVKVVKPNKEWDYFGKNVKVESGKIYMDGDYLGNVKKDGESFIATPPEAANLTNDRNEIRGDTIVEAVFRFLKYYVASI